MDFERLEMPLRDDVSSIDELNEDEIAALAIYLEIGHYFPDSYTRDDKILDILEHFDEQECFVARDEMGEICGVAGVDDNYSDDEFRVHGIAVHPDFRRQGVGQGLMEFLTGLARGQSKQHMGLIAMKSSLMFHESQGFTQVDGGHGLPLMRKSL